MSSARSRLAKLLNVNERELAFLAALDDAALARLHDDVTRARDEHAKTLKHAMEQALDQLPRLLRIPIRKLFGL